jgi:membrane protein YdbS with pleckstrin-like domain
MTEQGPQHTAQEVHRRFDVDIAADEAVLSIHTRHWIAFVKRLLVIILALVPLALLFWWLNSSSFQQLSWEIAIIVLLYLAGVALGLAYTYSDWRDDALIVTERRVIYIEQTILVRKSQREALLTNIQNVTTDDRGLLRSLLSYGDITIQTAARRTDINFGPIPQPRSVKQTIDKRRQELQAVTSAGLMRETLLYRLDPQHHQPPEIPGMSALEQERPAGLERAARRGFLPNPRIEGDTITWYRHWLFLLTRLFVPSLLLIALGVAAFVLVRMGLPAPAWVLWGVTALVIIFLLVYRYQLWKGDIYVLLPDSLEDIYRIPFGLGERRTSTNLERIQDVSIDQRGLLPRVLNYGNVRITTAGAEELTFYGLPRPMEVRAEVFRRQELARLRREQRQRDEIVNWLVAYREIDQRPPSE